MLEKLLKKSVAVKSKQRDIINFINLLKQDTILEVTPSKNALPCFETILLNAVYNHIA